MPGNGLARGVCRWRQVLAWNVRYPIQGDVFTQDAVSTRIDHRLQKEGQVVERRPLPWEFAWRDDG